MDLTGFRKKAEINKKGLKKFLKKLDKIVPEDMPELVSEKDAEVWEVIDCTHCANCCKTMTPTWTREDIKRAALHFGLSSKEFKKKWLHKEEESGDWVNVNLPCQFLDLNTNYCTIYEIRPADCAEFPHHNKKPFDLYNDTFSNNIDKCPATNLLIEKLKKKIEKEYIW